MPPPSERQSIKVQSERTVLAAVRLPDSAYDPSDPFGELKSLAEQAGAVVVGELSQNLPRQIAGTFIGRGKLKELKDLCDRLGASTIIFDHDLSPRQIGNIEKETDRKVLDRSELILDIFASRATTHEAKLQVELAQLEYTYPRLRAMWSHLERIVGSGGSAALTGGVGTRGPGEQQIEIDRRLVQRRKLELQRDLERIQGRKRRAVKTRNAEHFTVGLVGYTNAGKSTLFNTVTAGGAYADDRVFATLMTRTRKWPIGDGVEVMLSDTVGFVRDLPHNLIASFKATLEEATHADLLLIVLDVSDPACELHERTVQATLDELFDEIRRVEGDGYREPERVLLLNKVDRLPDNAEVLVWQHKRPGSIAISALPGDDGKLERVHAAIDRRPDLLDELVVPAFQFAVITRQRRD
ncbi:MAG: GTPase HflX, partial [Planctomycetota bacterium]